MKLWTSRVKASCTALEDESIACGKVVLRSIIGPLTVRWLFNGCEGSRN